MSTLEFELNNYYKRIKRNMLCSNSVKKLFIKDFKDRVDEYVDDNPNTTIEDIVINFGTPNDIIKGFGNELEFYKNKARKRLIITIVISVIAVATIGLLSYAIADMIRTFGGTITITTQ